MSLPRNARPGAKQDPLISRRQFLRLEAIARTLGIPVIDQYTYVVQNGGNLLAAQFRHDATGHSRATFGPVRRSLNTSSRIPQYAGGSNGAVSSFIAERIKFSFSRGL